MDTMVAEITNTCRSAGTKPLLPFKTPSLKLRKVGLRGWHCDGRRREARDGGLNLGERLSRGKSLEKRHIGSGSIFEESRLLVGCEVVTDECVGVQERWIT